MKKLTKNEDLAKQIKEEDEKKKSQQFKEKLNQRIQNKKLPKLARLKEDNNLECVLCKFVCKEEISFTKHYGTPLHKKALELFQVNCEKKKKVKEFKEKTINEEIKEEEVEKSDVIVGVKRSPPIEYRIEETYELIEDPEDDTLETNYNKEINGNNHNDEKIHLEEEINEEKLIKNLKEKENENESKKKVLEEKKEEEENEKIEKNLNKLLEEDGDELNAMIKDKLKLVKKLQENKKEELSNKNFESKEKKIENENGLHLDFFNWKKKKLF